MGTVWVKEFTGGLDSRRLPETTAGGVLLKANDGHITRGGEFEKRAAFVSAYTLPEGATVGLAYTPSGLVVFGSSDAPPGIPVGITYQKLAPPTPGLTLARVPSWTLYQGKIYAVAEWNDGSRSHFYDGTIVADWADGRARASFQIMGGHEGIPAVPPVPVSQVLVKIDGVTITAGAQSWATSNAATAAALADAINAASTAPDYTASAVGSSVTVTAATAGAAENGKAVSFVLSDGFTVNPSSGLSLAGGTDPDGHAFATFSITGGHAGDPGSPAVPASTLIVSVDGVAAVAGPIPWGVDNTATAAAIADAINSDISVPDYTATAVGSQVNIIAVASGVEPNGKAVTFTVANGFLVAPSTGTELAQGQDAVITDPGAAATASFTVTGGTASPASTLSITVDGVAIVSGPVTWTTDNTATAAAIATAINSFASTPDYSATNDGPLVKITAPEVGVASNGKAVAFAIANGFGVSPSGGTALAGGKDPASSYQPGSFVRTDGSRVLSVSGPLTYGSGLSQPTKWNTDTVGAFFIDMSSQTSGAEELQAIAKYQSYVAVFSERTIQIWFFDSDPTNNKQSQELGNTGTASPRSVTQFGDSDLFYLDESGIRSLRARDASNAAATADIGVPIDTIITAKLGTLTEGDRQNIVGLIEPRNGRFWLVVLDTIYVFSYFPGAKVSAWSTYTPGFEITDACVFRRRVYARSVDTIYCYGGQGADLVYDDTVAEAWLPYFDANKPTQKKIVTGIDIAARGDWEAFVAPDPLDDTLEERIGQLSDTTYNDGTVPARGTATHMSMRFRSSGEGPATLGAGVLHYELHDAED